MAQHDYFLESQAGANFRADLNDALQAIATNNSGASEPQITFAGMWWADTASGWLKQRDANNEAWVNRFPLDDGMTEFAAGLLASNNAAEANAALGTVGTSGDQTIGGVKTFLQSPVVPDEFWWKARTIGEPFGLWTDLGAPAPPNDNPNLKFIELTASAAYNTGGVLTGETVVANTPYPFAVATINFPASPMHGKTVRLINTERRIIRPGSPGVVQEDALQGHRHGSQVGQHGSGNGYRIEGREDTGSFTYNNVDVLDPIADGTNGTPRTANETRMRSVGARFFILIWRKP